MQEIEAKFYVNDLDQITARLRPPPPFGHLPQIRNKTLQKFIQYYSRIWGRLGGGLIQPRVLETNLRFDLPDGGLRSEGRVLRLRQDTEARLTYKDAGVSEQGLINRTEIEFTVGDFEKAKLFLEALGYQKWLMYEKYRTTYELQSSEVLRDHGGLVHVMLDELPYGNFVEIEGEDVESIHGAARALNLDLSASVTASYAALFERVKRALGLTFNDLTFENFGGLNITAEHLSIRRADGY